MPGSRADLTRAFDDAKRLGDLDAMAEAALGLAARQQFGPHPGRVPALVHEAYSAAHGATRIRLAAALARVWAYGYRPDRAAPFAAEAVAAAEADGDPAVLAEALDATLLVCWGPDDLVDRVRITAQLEDVVAHLSDVEARMSAYLWRLTTALESLDLITVQRQLRSLDDLADESGSARVRFIATSRRGMHALLVGDLAAADRLTEAACRAGTDAGEADVNAIERSLRAGIARQAGDRAALAAEASAFEAFGVGEGVVSIAAEGASLWLAAGSPERARALLDRLAGGDLAAIPRDVDWLLTVASLTEVAAATGAADLAAAAVHLLEPYAGRGVVNAGAVSFIGVVDDYLRQACASLGQRDDARRWAGAAAAGYQRLGASWWLQRLDAPARPHADATPTTVHLRPGPGVMWTVGTDGAALPLPDMKGLAYLRLLLARPGVEMSALDLSDQVAGHAGAGSAQSDLGEVIDRRAIAEYRRRITELDEDLAEAEGWADPARATRLRAERDAIVEHLTKAAGLGGRTRVVGATAERARIAVRKAIAAAIGRIEEHDPALARRLRDTVRTGMVCRYDPDPTRPITWLLDADPSTHQHDDWL
jgi:hypothetical protein